MGIGAVAVNYYNNQNVHCGTISASKVPETSYTTVYIINCQENVPLL